ncbi:MAG: ribosome biogenesis GTP-binding protein YihA/YsxC [Thermodesulfobacteriota bacterium]|nr:ribosome biogenesis GTP-binding protein YihA/YsxC [Thermodesulfobacteriota bacterium]
MEQIKQVEFLISAFSRKQFPEVNLPEIAFVGRSNVGKSTLINTLLNRKKVARTSSSPGCTQSINFFLINNKFVFADLPGFGYAKVPLEVKKKWKPLVESYFHSRKNLKIVILITDIRRKIEDDEYNLLLWFDRFDFTTLLLVTKIDKLSRSRWENKKKDVQKQIHPIKLEPILFSAVTKEGRKNIWQKIQKGLTFS